MKRITERFGYTHPRFPGAIDLSLNESPYGCSANVCKAIVERIDELATYPDDELYTELRNAIAKVHSGKPENIVLTDGGMGALDLIFSSLKKTAVFVQRPTFEPIEHRIKYYDHEQASDPAQANICVFLNPNNPTGELLNIKDFVYSLTNRETVVVDEEYADYARWSVLTSQKIMSNLLVTRSFSKAYGLPSMRIGWITCSAEMADYLRDVRYPWRIGRMSCIAAKAAVEDQDFIQSVIDTTIETRSNIEKALEEQGCNYTRSHANYIMMHVDDSDKVCLELLKQGFVVRNLKERTGTNSIRFMIHLPAVMERFLKILLEVL